MVLSFVGSGGKTTAIFTLAARLRGLGRRVLVTTTTHMQNPCNPNARRRNLPLCEERFCCLSGDAAEIMSRLETDGYCQAGLPAEGKLGPLPEPVYQAACAGAGVVLVEADGSRTLPLKYPAGYEPVIPGNTDEIFVLCGLSALGKPLSQATHRLPLALEALNGEPGRAPASPDTLADPALIARLYQKGYLEPLRRRFPSVRLFPSQAVTLYQRCAAALLAAELDPAPLRENWFTPSALRKKGFSESEASALPAPAGPRPGGAFALVLRGDGTVPSGSLLLLWPDGTRAGTLGGGEPERRALDTLRALLHARKDAEKEFPPAFPPPAACLETMGGSSGATLLLGTLDP